MRTIVQLGLMLLVACSASTTSPAGGGSHAAACQLACTSMMRMCSAQDPATCEQDCATVTASMSDACTQCVLDNSGWEGLQCQTYGLCPVFASDHSWGQNGNCTTTANCTSANERCNGFYFAKPQSLASHHVACATACGLDGG